MITAINAAKSNKSPSKSSGFQNAPNHADHALQHIPDSTHPVFNRAIITTIILIVATTLIAYYRILDNGFIDFDDKLYITGNKHVLNGLTADSFRWAFSFSNTNETYWHPLTWLSLMMDVTLFGNSPAVFHAMNVLIHTMNATLLFYFFYLSTGNKIPSALLAVLFAVHPMNVEAVAWAVERKTVLCTFFLCLALLSYRRYVKKADPASYCFTGLAFIAGILTKPVIVTLPFLLLLLDFWPLQRFGKSTQSPIGNQKLSLFGTSPKALFLEKVPLLLISCASIAVSLFSLRDTANSTAPAISDPLSIKLQNAIFSYAAYLKKLFIPSDLSVYYPLKNHYPLLVILFCALLLLAITTSAFYFREKMKWLFCGIFWYFIAMFPTIGFVRAQLWPEMADRFAYIPFIGLFMVISFAAHYISSSFGNTSKRIALAIAAIFIGGLLAVTIQRVGVWHDSLSLWSDAYKKHPSSRFINEGLAEALEKNKLYPEAARHYALAIKADPNAPELHNKLGTLSIQMNLIENAAASFSAAMLLTPGNNSFRTNFAAAKLELGELSTAKNVLEPIFSETRPDLKVSCMLAAIAREEGELHKAMRYYAHAKTYNPDEAEKMCSEISSIIEKNRRKPVHRPVE